MKILTQMLLAPLLVGASLSSFAAHSAQPPNKPATHTDTPAPAPAAPTGAELVNTLLRQDPWGLGGAEVTARAIHTTDNGRKRELVFEARSRRDNQLLSKSWVHFSKPADVSGVKFLQIQSASGDDERHLYTPSLKRARRVASRMRDQAFMGTDFSYADMDRRELRVADAKIKGDEKLGAYECTVVEITPRDAERQYSKIEVWVRKDNQVGLVWRMYDRDGKLSKTLQAKELQQIEGQWFITRSLMFNHKGGSNTELLLEKIVPRNDLPEDIFTVQHLEK